MSLRLVRDAGRDDAHLPLRIARAATAPLPAYAELHCLSNFSFLRGASWAQELFERARQQGYRKLAITDECTLAGIVRARRAAIATGMDLVVGSEFAIDDGPRCVLLVENLAGYEALCDLITRARRRASKGTYRSLRGDFERSLDGLLALWLPGTVPDESHAQWLRSRFPSRLWMAVELHRGPDDDARLGSLRALARSLGLPAVATGDAHMHVRGRRALQDTLTAIRLRVPLAEAGHALFPNGERHLRTRRALSAIYPADLLQESVRIAERCTFDLGELRYEYPHEAADGLPPPERLRRLVEAGIVERWRTRPRVRGDAEDMPFDRVRAMIEHELSIIGKLNYESFFLTVHDIVRFAKSRGILCQGRGSSANSVVCYALGITELRPGDAHLLFERFVSEKRTEPPDIDVDFEHERREEVLQYVFSRYGRERAALVAVVIHYRGRSAVRDVGTALGLPLDQLEDLVRGLDRWSMDAPSADYLAGRGLDPDAPVMRRLAELVEVLIGFPRHLSQHPGGFVISERPLSSLVPVENAAMDARTVVQWDKDDLEDLRIMKVDCLALGMLSCIRRTFDLLRTQGIEMTQHAIPHGDEATYAMIRRADTVGVFQIESRAQMSMLPRLQPREYYDLVIQVAIVRPGPIQGEMVHPYLRRRRGEEAVHYPTPGLQSVLGRTLGVPLFQEQVMEIAMKVAGYTAADADELRRSMAAWKHHGDMNPHRQRLLDGLVRGGCTREFADALFNQLKGFGSYGFPESHAASFALLAYQSSYLKCHYPAAFAAALINSQPMGFYGPSQIVQDARRHGIDVRPVDVRYSDWDCTLESRSERSERSGAGHAMNGTRADAVPGPQPALRLGLCLVKGFDEPAARRIEAACAVGAFADVTDLALRADLDARAMARLADASALRGLAGHRHRARWAVAGVEARRALFDGVGATAEPQVTLPLPGAVEEVRADYSMLGLSLDHHPIALLRPRLRRRRFVCSRDLPDVRAKRVVTCAGLVTLRQRPQTASGVTFVTLEDEFGLVNVIVWRDLGERQRRELVESRLLAVRGCVEQEQGVLHLVARSLECLDDWMGPLRLGSRDFH